MKKQILYTAILIISTLINTPIFAGCPSSYNLTCGELFTNGGFNYFDVDPADPNFVYADPFAPANNHVCDWELGGNTPQIKETAGSYYSFLYCENSSLNGIKIESILKPIQLYANTTYILTFKLRKNGASQLPKRFKVNIFNEVDIASNIINTNPSENIVNLAKAQIDASGDWHTYIFCFSPTVDTDRMLFSRKQPQA